jgi:hypothetical protein
VRGFNTWRSSAGAVVRSSASAAATSDEPIQDWRISRTASRRGISKAAVPRLALLTGSRRVHHSLYDETPYFLVLFSAAHRNNLRFSDSHWKTQSTVRSCNQSRDAIPVPLVLIADVFVSIRMYCRSRKWQPSAYQRAVVSVARVMCSAMRL